MIPESQRLERLAERLRAVEPARVSPTAKIRAWNLVAAGLQKPSRVGLRSRSRGRLVVAGLAAAALLVAGTVAAAADSLPDSALYPIKGALESVEGVFAVTAKDQFNHHLALAGSRLVEAEAMFARHRVDLAEQALAGMEDQLTSAAILVKTTKAVDPAVSASLERELQQAVETHDNQLAGLQGEVTNSTAVDAITRARNRAQDALQVAAAPSDQGQGSLNGSSDKARGQGGNGSASSSIKPSRHP